MNESEMVGFGFLTIDNDEGQSVRIPQGDNSFEYLEEVYAVVLLSVEDVEPGEVVVVNDAVKDAKVIPPEPQKYLLRVKGVGLYQAANFILLDRTNVFPGLVVQDTDGTWQPVRRVDECLWVMVEGSDVYRSPEEFHFAVSGSDILTEPIVKCIMADGLTNLTVGKCYRLKRTRENGTVDVSDDSGDVREFMSSRFKMED